MGTIILRYQLSGGEQISRLIDDMQMENERLMYDQDEESDIEFNQEILLVRMEDPRLQNTYIEILMKKMQKK